MENVAASTSQTPAHAPSDDVVRVLQEDGTLAPHAGAELADDQAIALYRVMVRVRAVDERLALLHRQGIIAPHAASHGEEAAVIGAAAAMRPQDWIFPAARSLGAALWRGASLASYVSHVFGAAPVSTPITTSAGTDGDPRGHHARDPYASRAAKIASIGTPLGSQITHAAGLAWAARMKRDDVAALVYFDEETTSCGEFHNGVNFAGAFKAPLVLFCRDSARFDARAPITPVALKSVAYGIAGARCDGGDLFAVLQVTRAAIARAARGEGPTLIEALVAAPNARSRDPLARVRHHLEARGVWTDAKQRAAEAEIDAEIEAAIAAAEARAPLARATLFVDVYATLPRHLEEQQRDLEASGKT